MIHVRCNFFLIDFAILRSFIISYTYVQNIIVVNFWTNYKMFLYKTCFSCLTWKHTILKYCTLRKYKKKSCTVDLYFCVVHPDMAVYIRIVPILEKLRTVLMPQLPYIGHGSLKKIFSHKGFRFFLENLGQSTKALALYSP